MKFTPGSFKAFLLFSLILLPLMQSAQAGLAAAVIVQRTIINQCIIQAEEGPADIAQLNATYGSESAEYLYVNGVKIFDVTVKFESQGKIVSYACDEFFPELAPIHFYKGDWNQVLANLSQEVSRLRQIETNRYGKHLSLR